MFHHLMRCNNKSIIHTHSKLFPFLNRYIDFSYATRISNASATTTITKANIDESSEKIFKQQVGAKMTRSSSSSEEEAQSITRVNVLTAVSKEAEEKKKNTMRRRNMVGGQEELNTGGETKSFDDYFQLSEKDRQKEISRLKKQTPTRTTENEDGVIENGSLVENEDGEEEDSAGDKIRLNRYLARMGMCSRRQADELIQNGAIKVNQKPMTNIGCKVSSTDIIHINGQLISSEKMHEKLLEPKLYAFNKPRGMLCSRIDETNTNRLTMYDQLYRMGFGHLMSVGRLDYNSEGLLLLTNDGDLKRYLELPDSHLEREYLVRVHGYVTQEHLDQFRRGAFNVDGRTYGAIKAEIRSQTNDRTTWLRVSMFEGKNREIRKVFQHFNMAVSRLIRIRYGPYDLGDMQKSTLKTLKVKPEFVRHCSKQFANIFEKKEQTVEDDSRSDSGEFQEYSTRKTKSSSPPRNDNNKTYDRRNKRSR